MLSALSLASTSACPDAGNLVARMRKDPVMGFYFTNKHSSEAWVVFMWYQPDCSDGGQWEKAGWWHLNPGETKQVHTDLNHGIAQYYFYAHAADGAEWAGDVTSSVPPTRFDWCINTGSTNSRTVGFRPVYTGDYDNYTVGLV